MKKITVIVLSTILMISSILTGCTNTKNKEDDKNKTSLKKDKLHIVTTLFPQYDFVKQIAGDKADVKLLLSPGQDSHSFEPTPEDIIAIQNADVFIYNGGEAEAWIDKVIDSIDTKKVNIIKMMDYVKAVKEEEVEGMEPEDEHDHEKEELEQNGENNNQDHEDEEEYDEHIWTSPKNAIRMVEGIKDTLVKVDNINSKGYNTNYEKYIKELEKLDKLLIDTVSKAKRKMLVFGDKFPFRYLVDDYGLTYRAAFNGCSTQTEPSIETVTYLINKVKENKIPAIYHIEMSNKKIAKTISEETGAKVLLLHSAHNVTKEEFNKGITYIDIMNNNITNLKEGLE
ncbi:metal ABC transporter substrate-binding protein [Clostridium sp. CCUG 7971]|uniref:metal ABC transporter substrate-binding protein n=1 Tax=Clostridium sp. CCUG 7971 TaxID=2811414 RepID=UPI001ABA997F|nr:metal ABC transporter substrate-binding protein [Clostridium sp. CCUG 7971]MBO3445779.1 zinc ABC transporter substrate-binding protein [Clostridium sp. CCUG 7971]